MNDELSNLRIDYGGDALDQRLAGTDPVRLFRTWFDEAAAAPGVPEPNAMSIATCAPDGTPSVRMVLLKHVDDARAAFACYTNLESRKAREALASRRAALCWWWPGQPARQVRVVGSVQQVDRVRAAAYFESRPAAARAGAVASQQSRAIVGRSVLDERLAAVEPERAQIPDNWGGLWIVADEVEFWQGRVGRLHDRIAFLRVDEDGRVASSAAVDSSGGPQRLEECSTAVTDAHGTRWLRVRLAP